MLDAVRRVVRQFPLAVVGLFMLGGTAVTALAALKINPREHRRERAAVRAPRPMPGGDVEGAALECEAP
jgi:hypothetical protein